MAINPLDAERFFEVFVEIGQDGRTFPYTHEYYEYVSQQVDTTLLENWTAYLRRQSTTLSEDEFYDWYDNMTFDTIDHQDAARYHLPTAPLTFILGNEESFMTGAHKIISNWYESCNISTNDMAIVSMTFNSTIIYASYDILTGCDYNKARDIKTSFDAMFKSLQSLVKQFNTTQGKTGMHIDCVHIARAMDSSTRAFYNEDGKLIKSVNARDISISLDDLFYSYNKKPVETNRAKQFFSIIPEDDRTKGMKDPGSLSYDEFAKLTKKTVTT